MSNPLHVIAELVAKPEHADAARTLLRDFATSSRTEPGCIAYDLLEVEGEPGRFMTFETWADQGAMDTHMSTPQIQAALPIIGPMLAKPFSQVVLRPAKA